MALPPDFTLLQVVPELETGGAEQTTIDVARAVIAAGGRAFVATRGARMTARLAQGPTAHGSRRCRCDRRTSLVMLGNSPRALVDLIRAEKVSLVHARSRAPAFAALWAARTTKTPFVATYHGVYKAQSSLEALVQGAVMTRGDLVIATSEYTRAHVLAEHAVDPARVIAIPRGVDLDRFNPAWVTQDRIEALRRAWGVADGDTRTKFLLAGRLTPHQGPPDDHRGGEARWKASGRADFLIWSSPATTRGRTSPMARNWRRRSPRRALGDQVRAVGHCDDMPAAYLLADVAILPTTVPESFGRAAVGARRPWAHAVIAAEPWRHDRRKRFRRAGPPAG